MWTLFLVYFLKSKTHFLTFSNYYLLRYQFYPLIHFSSPLPHLKIRISDYVLKFTNSSPVDNCSINDRHQVINFFILYFHFICKYLFRILRRFIISCRGRCLYKFIKFIIFKNYPQNLCFISFNKKAILISVSNFKILV